ncbi:MAG: NmrA family transcriptional regulator, partial [Proteobacteria bacterium]
YVIPPSNSFNDPDAYYKDFAKPTCDAINEQKIKRVVFISGTGLGFDKKAGAVYSSSLVETMLEATLASVRTVHAGTFMENLLHAVGTIKGKSEIYNLVPPDTKYCWVATKDIADASVKLLLDKSWTGKGSVAVLGPEDISFNDIAAKMSEKLGRPIKYVQSPAEVLKKTYMQYGASDAAAQSVVDIHESVGRGTFNRIKRTKENSTATSFAEWFDANMKVLLG